MYSYGLLYLPVSTYSLLCASQLAFNAVFSYFLNSLKLTPFVINSLVLLTVSATVLGMQSEPSGPSHLPKGKYIIGFLCTIGASALYSLWLSLTQVFFEKVMKRETFSVVLEVQIYTALVATLVCVAGLFISGEWKELTEEMELFKTGKVSYIMTLVWTAVLWQVFAVSCLGLIFEASALFSNVISTVCLPVVPIFAVILFHDKMDGMKAVAMMLAIWGFVSYAYEHYLDYSKLRAAKANANDRSVSYST
ncbi:Purine permease 21 [Ranunculus cassubicifolius]